MYYVACTFKEPNLPFCEQYQLSSPSPFPCSVLCSGNCSQTYPAFPWLTSGHSVITTKLFPSLKASPTLIFPIWCFFLFSHNVSDTSLGFNDHILKRVFISVACAPAGMFGMYSSIYLVPLGLK